MNRRESLRAMLGSAASVLCAGLGSLVRKPSSSRISVPSDRLPENLYIRGPRTEISFGLDWRRQIEIWEEMYGKLSDPETKANIEKAVEEIENG